MIKSLNFLTMFFVVNVLTAGPNLARKVRETDVRKVRETDVRRVFLTDTNIILKVHLVSVTGGSLVITGEIVSASQRKSIEETYSKNDEFGASSVSFRDKALVEWTGSIVSVASNPDKKDADGCVSLAMQAAALEKSISIRDVAEEQIDPNKELPTITMPPARNSGIDHYLNNLRGCTLSFK